MHGTTNPYTKKRTEVGAEVTLVFVLLLMDNCNMSLQLPSSPTWLVARLANMCLIRRVSVEPVDVRLESFFPGVGQTTMMTLESEIDNFVHGVISACAKRARSDQSVHEKTYLFDSDRMGMAFCGVVPSSSLPEDTT